MFERKGGAEGSTSTVDRGSWRERLLWFLPLAAIYLLVVAPIILSGRIASEDAADQEHHHYVVIEKMTLEWPDVDLVDYPSATSPGYHLALAGVAKAVGGFEEAKPALRWINALVGLATVGVAYGVCCFFTNSARAAALTMPYTLNQYVLGQGAYVSTDNASYLLIFIAVGLCLAPGLSWRRGPALTISAVGGVLARQSSIFCIAPIGLAGVLASPLARIAPRWAALRAATERRWSTLAACAVAAIAATGVLAWLIVMWGGLTPPVYRSLHDLGANPATPAAALAIAGALGGCFATALAPLRASLRVRPALAIGVAALGLLSATIPETAPTWTRSATTAAEPKGGDAQVAERPGPALRGEWTHPETGRTLRYFVPGNPEAWAERRLRAFGWSWRISEMLPTPFERSSLHLLLAPIGALFLLFAAAGGVRAGRAPVVLLLLVTVAAWLSAQSMNSMAWHGYFEPKLLAFLPWLTAMAIGDRRLPRWAWIGPAGLMAFQASITAASLLREVWLTGG